MRERGTHDVVERLTAFEKDVKVEASQENKDVGSKIKKNWPSDGKITFKDVRARYRAGLPEVLKGVSFSLPGGKKLGICGRTGSGKSSLTLCLWRMLDEIRGSIQIDGADTSKVALHELRSKRAITTRSDPFHRYPSLQFGPLVRKLMRNLEVLKVHLEAFVKDLPNVWKHWSKKAVAIFLKGNVR